METIVNYFNVVPLDWVVIGGIGLLVALDTLRAGMGRALSLSLAIVITLTLAAALQKAAFIASLVSLDSPNTQAIAIGVILVASYFLVRRIGFEFIDTGMGQPIQALLVGAATAVFVALFITAVPVIGSYIHTSPQFLGLFAEQFQLWWVLGSLAILAFARG